MQQDDETLRGILNKLIKNPGLTTQYIEDCKKMLLGMLDSTYRLEIENGPNAKQKRNIVPVGDKDSEFSYNTDLIIEDDEDDIIIDSSEDHSQKAR